MVFGAESSSNPKKNYKIINDFAQEISIIPIFSAIPIYAQEKVRLRKVGKMISDFDLLIGSTVIANNLIMITENINEFERIRGIEIENWIIR